MCIYNGSLVYIVSSARVCVRVCACVCMHAVFTLHSLLLHNTGTAKPMRPCRDGSRKLEILRSESDSCISCACCTMCQLLCGLPFRYQKTKETLSGWGGKASSAMQKAGTAIKWDTLNSA